MSKLTGGIVFVAGILLVVLTIASILVRNEQIHEETPIESVSEVVVGEMEHEEHFEIPLGLKIAMYITLLVSSGFTISHVVRYGLSNKGMTSSTIAFIGGIVLVTLGFFATLAENESRMMAEEQAGVHTELVVVEEHEAGQGEGHKSHLPKPLHHTMMAILFIGGGFTIIHITRFGLC